MTTSWTSPYFTKAEMACRCGCGGLPRKEFMNLLTAVRREANFPFIVSSGFRCAEYNQTVSTTGDNGPHTMGLAADIKVHGKQAVVLTKLALKWGMTGIGVSQKGPQTDRFIHVDSIPEGDLIHSRPRIWSY